MAKPTPKIDGEVKIHYYNGVEVREQGEYFWISRLCKHFYKFPADFLKQKQFREVHQRYPASSVSASGTWVHKETFLVLAEWLSADCGAWAKSLLTTAPSITLEQYIQATAKLFGVDRAQVLSYL